MRICESADCTTGKKGLRLGLGLRPHQLLHFNGPWKTCLYMWQIYLYIFTEQIRICSRAVRKSVVHDTMKYRKQSRIDKVLRVIFHLLFRPAATCTVHTVLAGVIYFVSFWTTFIHRETVEVQYKQRAIQQQTAIHEKRQASQSSRLRITRVT